MNAKRTTIEAQLIPAVVSIAAVPGDSLVIVNGVCVGVERTSTKASPVTARSQMEEADIQPLSAISVGSRKKGGIPAEDLIEDLLVTLYDLEGPTPTKNVLDKMEPRIAPKLKPVDYDKLSSGDIRWRNRVQWARYLAVKSGLISKEDRGMWELSEAGRRRVEEIRRKQSSSGGR